jgi:hypothetical protein
MTLYHKICEQIFHLLTLLTSIIRKKGHNFLFSSIKGDHTQLETRNT